MWLKGFKREEGLAGSEKKREERKERKEKVRRKVRGRKGGEREEGKIDGRM